MMEKLYCLKCKEFPIHVNKMPFLHPHLGTKEGYTCSKCNQLVKEER